MVASALLSPRSLITVCVVILAFLGAAPVALAACDDQVLERPFMPWGDPVYYTLVPDGDLTAGGAGWDLDGADLVADNEPWYVHGGDTPAALRLRRGDSATTHARLRHARGRPRRRSSSPATCSTGRVRFRFRATGIGSAWVIDDVYVDPYKKG